MFKTTELAYFILPKNNMGISIWSHYQENMTVQLEHQSYTIFTQSNRDPSSVILLIKERKGMEKTKYNF